MRPLCTDTKAKEKSQDNYRPISFINMNVQLSKNTIKSNPAPSKYITQDTQVGYIPDMLGWFSI